MQTRIPALAAALCLLGAVPALSAQTRAVDSYTSSGAIITDPRALSVSEGYTFTVNTTEQITHLGVFFPTVAGSPSASLQVGLFAGTTNTLLTSVIVQPTATITRADPDGSSFGTYRYAAITPFVLTAGSTYTILSAFAPGGGTDSVETLQFVQHAVFDPAFTFQSYATGSDAVAGANNGVAFDTYHGDPESPSITRAVAGPDFLFTPLDVTPTPEPASLVLVATGLAVAGVAARRRRRAARRGTPSAPAFTNP